MKNKSSEQKLPGVVRTSDNIREPNVSAFDAAFKKSISEAKRLSIQKGEKK